MGLEDLAQRSPLVVHGVVVQLEVRPDDGSRFAILEALDVVRAPPEFQHLRDFVIPLLDRKIPGTSLVERIVGAPELILRQEVLVFLRPMAKTEQGRFRRADGQAVFFLDGLAQGVFSVVEDSLGVRWVARDGDQALALADAELVGSSPTPRFDAANKISSAKQERHTRRLVDVLSVVRQTQLSGSK